ASILPPDAVSYEWIPRERNGHADRLANEAMDAGRRGETWQPSASTAELAARDADALAEAAPATPESSAEARAAARDAVRRAARGAASRPGGTAPDPARDTGADPTALPEETEPKTPSMGWGPSLDAPTTLVLLRHGETPLTP